MRAGINFQPILFLSSPVFFIFIFFYEECSSSSSSNTPLFPPSRYFSFSLKERITFGTCSVSNHEILFRKRARKVPRKWTPKSPIFPSSKGNTLKTLGLGALCLFLSLSWAFLPQKRKSAPVFTERFFGPTKDISRPALHFVRWSCGKNEWGYGYSVNPKRAHNDDIKSDVLNARFFTSQPISHAGSFLLLLFFDANDGRDERCETRQMEPAKLLKKEAVVQRPAVVFLTGALIFVLWL